MARKYSQEGMDALLARYYNPSRPLVWSEATGKVEEIDNPEWEKLSQGERIRAEAGDPRYANIPKKIKVPTMSWANADVTVEAYIEPGTGQYVVTEEKRDPTPSVTAARKETPVQDAEAEAKAARERDQRWFNLNRGPDYVDPDTGQRGWGSGIEETHAERAARERQAESDALSRENAQRARRDQTIQEEAILRAEENREAERRERERKAATDAATTAANQAMQREQNNLAREKFTADQERLNRPDLVGTPTDTSKNVAVWDPVTQTLSSVPNPMYDAAKVEAARLKDQLSTAIALNQISAQQAAQQYKQWWDTNVELPFKQAQEQRARAAEQRAALEAEDRRKQFASDFSLRSSDLGFRAGNAAVQNEISLLPYRAGPEAGEQFSAAFNSLAKGGKVYGPDASAGINFTADAFEFDRPDFEGIAKKATANALKGLTKYKPSGSFSQANYEGIATPSGAGAPSGGPMIDTSQLWQQYAGGLNVPPYTGPEE